MIGNMVSYLNEYKEKTSGEVVDISSDRFDDVKWLTIGDGELARPHYWSKKKKSYEPVKDKDMDSIYFEVKGRGCFDYIYLKDIVV
jgi:hypothetical protein|tara:strand:- start:234 stop:491 length:258 start_codon:yes stop_codon:yes gene_type:complete